MKHFYKALAALLIISLVFSSGASFSAPWDLDMTFDPGSGPNLWSSQGLGQIGMQPDGKIIIAGNFSDYNGITRNKIARLNTDGTLDTSFDPGSGADTIRRMVTLPSGKILITGLTSYSSITVWGIARINADGTLDTSFNIGWSGAEFGTINSILVQGDEKIIISGNFFLYNGVTKYGFTRLNADGTLDTSFDPGSGWGPFGIWLSHLLSTGKILIYDPALVSYNGTARAKIAKINSDGSLDSSFITSGGGPNQTVLSFIEQGEKVIIAGQFTSYSGTTVNRIARLNADGTLDTGFNLGWSGANNMIRNGILQPDGKIIIVGDFSDYNGIPRNKIARLNTDGTLDTSFDPGSGANTFIISVLQQPDNRLGSSPVIG